LQEVALVELADQVMLSLDFEMAQILHKNISDEGVRLYLDNGVDHFNDTGQGIEVVLKDQTKVQADIVIFAIGVRPVSDLAKNAGLNINQRGGIIVDEHLRTSDSDIFAVGDVIEVKHLVSQEQTMIPLAGPANKQGRMVAENILGGNETYKGTQGTGIAKVFDLQVGSTGLNEKWLKSHNKKLGEDYQVVIIHPKSHAGYYPGAHPIALKMIYDL